ncbi:MAG TPA: glycogen debranching N-terminal domain-containing protein [Vicinamibacterales bacterium]|nr:glycogen debranching N-terminal domain-containing protein [Vicinamibacterales bacterium]
MTKRTAVAPRSVAAAVAIKDEDIFFLCDPTGQVPLGNVDGLGLYYHDCRFLDGYELLIAGTHLNPLTFTARNGFMAAFALTNHDISPRRGPAIAKQRLDVRWERVVDARQHALHDTIAIGNLSQHRASVSLSFAFQSTFEDVFTIRGFHPRRHGRLAKPAWSRGALVFAYAGADGVERRLCVQFDPAPRSRTPGGADIPLTIAPGQTAQVRVSLRIEESSSTGLARGKAATHAQVRRVTGKLQRNAEEWLGTYTRVVTSSPLLNMVVDRSLRDLRVLRSSLRRRQFFSAGLPWYAALFGRDSLIAGIETLAYEPSVAADTARLLAGFQGTTTDEWRDEEPGKILHELRLGELAHLNEIPQTPYYGSVDSTPLFLVLIGLQAQWTGDLGLFEELREHIERAFDWIEARTASAGTGYLTYESKSKQGLGNQGWKDSGDSIVNADGTLATPPIALVEVQGYVYLAKCAMAGLYDIAGDAGTARRLRSEAQDLKVRFNRDFWVAGNGMYALALQAGNRPAAVVSSNPGQALWSGIVTPSRARQVGRRLTSPAMFSGWGIRTLSSDERRFNPIGYHVGTVWPHDNAIIAAGLRHYGLDEAATMVCSGIVHAAGHFHHYRLPETFCGFDCGEYGRPVPYPVACHPQAWAAGAVPFMIERLLGLVPRAFEQRLRIVRPQLPPFVDRLELHRLRVGRASLDLRFVRMGDGRVGVEVLRQRGTLHVEVDPDVERGAA